ncbi:hypothetical protein BBJ28_00000579 [Nothophytophthora sp. Chile5]|nr:hypothetical protein BBJ28_00000579 [Nothophytophthora sp. Chile5]
MPVKGTPFSQTRSRKLASSRMHIEVLSRKILPFSFRSVRLPFVMHGHSAMRKYEGDKRDVIVFSSMNLLVKMFAKDVSGVQYFEKVWLVFAPTSDDAPDLCAVQLCAGVTLDVDARLPNRKRCVKLLTELLTELPIEQKRQELNALRLGVEDLLLTSAIS